MTKTESEKPKRSFAEWVTFSIALLILAVIMSLVGYIWLNDKNQPPIVSVTNKQTIREINGQFYVPFEVVNTGGDTAESVQIIAELQINGKVVETGEQQIDFLSRDEREEGAFIFSQNPRQGKLTLRVSSYKLP
ncbi:TIGR02588 family protein [Halotia branconii]|uniref:TIGR02588 family protein n=1 Tax=Halotia branconii CENA392 TaxID=1539056 RepID=A0AAJ6PAM7_9CYAN|nr:TIGR02588 family protein [Halotia branconii]WGV26881.1 TIGR02588 family protein [Halotia branconii CENA392]